jgi:hypothetical protein
MISDLRDFRFQTPDIAVILEVLDFKDSNIFAFILKFEILEI